MKTSKGLKIKELLSNFTAQQINYHKEVDKLFDGTYRDCDKQFPCSVNAVENVIIPLFSALKEHFPQLHIPDKNNYGLNGGYYKMKIGDHIIGGFSYPSKGIEYLIYIPFTNNPGKTVNYKIFQIQDLIQIIQKQLD